MKLNSGIVQVLLMVITIAPIACFEGRINSQTLSPELYNNLASFEQFGGPVINAVFNNISLAPDAKFWRHAPNVKCVDHLTLLFNALGEGEIWALKFFDAWGKVPAGLLEGNLNELGHFTECMKIKKELTETNVIRGKYCIGTPSLGELLPVDNPFLDWIFLNIGICLPDSCNAREYNQVFIEMLQIVYGITLNETLSYVDEKKCSTSERKPLSGLAIATIIIFSTFLLLVLMGTIYDRYHARNAKSPNVILMSFSLNENMKRLFQLNGNQSGTYVIASLNGIRCLSMLWVVFGHATGSQLTMPIINTFDTISWYESFWSITTRNATFAVDTFFFLSGLLVVMGGLREMDRNNGKLNVFLMYLNRYLRLTPLFAFAIMFYMSIMPRLGSGPMWYMLSDATENCKDSWWANILYVQNIVRRDKPCLGHAWYLSVDTQLFLFAPLALFALHKWRGKGVLGIVGIGGLLFLCIFTKIIAKDISIWKMIQQFDTLAMDQLYYYPHTRALSWIVGLIFGYFMYLNKDRRPKISKPIIIMGWSFALAVLVSMMYSLYPYLNGSGKELSNLGGAFYYSCSLVGWPLVLCWIVFACQNGYGGLINAFLSWSYWQPFSKLSYAIYIWHWQIDFVNLCRNKCSSFFSNYDVILRFWSVFGLTLCITLVVYLVIEAPLGQLQTSVLKKRIPQTITPLMNTSNQEQNRSK